MLSTLLQNFLPLSSNLKLLSAYYLSLEESKIYCLGKNLKFVVWERVKNQPECDLCRCVMLLVTLSAECFVIGDDFVKVEVYDPFRDDLFCTVVVVFIVFFVTRFSVWGDGSGLLSESQSWLLEWSPFEEFDFGFDLNEDVKLCKNKNRIVWFTLPADRILAFTANNTKSHPNVTFTKEMVGWLVDWIGV